ncbi:hypothetical protein LCGC14_2793720 [marine sediment metagenome]|uniref:Uncharacterized protein n=1 Tax=marine sediment metagenome TaxID=412755 RepID=A0A0F8ZC00_9ZZZZ
MRARAESRLLPWAALAALVAGIILIEFVNHVVGAIVLFAYVALAVTFVLSPARLSAMESDDREASE